jgi:hypothetical protein
MVDSFCSLVAIIGLAIIVAIVLGAKVRVVEIGVA